MYSAPEQPVHAVNLVSVMDDINAKYHNPIIIAVDARLGKADRVGFINVKPGVSTRVLLCKVLPAVGDLHISGIVNVEGSWNTWFCRTPSEPGFQDVHVIAYGLRH